MDIYREKLLDHYENPRNFGEIVDADAIMELENAHCGDRLKFFLRLEEDTVEEVKFEGEGCAIAVAAASLLSEHIKGKGIKEIELLDLGDVLHLLGTQLTMSRVKCAELSLETIQKALENGKKTSKSG